ncbi:uncharacterized protein [Drosophila kikkawai]|uniref:MD-2-related lipid-recognition domain-containing protein n=1 Tax=Drosophila kikkawai TaxID=30033 RepID=A0A6P4IYF5_DROKI|nr:uncharacterized protein LOC108078588 [Drosophila kikkawai]KAH8343129.1 hypothetical protein KR059_005424 [Drosophila kikkawai]
MKGHLWSLLLSVLAILGSSQGKVFKISKMECRTLDPSFTYFKTCKVVRRENGRAALYINEVMLYKQPIDDIILNLAVFKVSKNRRFQFLNETLDYCLFSRQLMANGLFGFLMAPMLRISNLNVTCPLQQDLIFNGFSIDENTIKEIPIPNGVYMFQMRSAMMKKWRSDVKVYATRVDTY